MLDGLQRMWQVREQVRGNDAIALSGQTQEALTNNEQCRNPHRLCPHASRQLDLGMDNAHPLGY